VKSGDVLAQMDTALMDAEIARSGFRPAGRQGDFCPVSARHDRLHQSGRERRQERRGPPCRPSKMRQRSDAAQAEELRKELRRREDLLSKRLIDEIQVNELRPQLAALDQTLAAYPAIIANYQRAKGQRAEATRCPSKLASPRRERKPVVRLSNKTDSSAAIVAATRETYLRRREGYTLRANRDGTVARIFIWPGNVVPAGTPIMNIVEEEPQNAIGFLPEFTPSSFKSARRCGVAAERGLALVFPARNGPSSMPPWKRCLPMWKRCPCGSARCRSRCKGTAIAGPKSRLPAARQT